MLKKNVVKTLSLLLVCSGKIYEARKFPRALYRIQSELYTGSEFLFLLFYQKYFIWLYSPLRFIAFIQRLIFSNNIKKVIN